MVLAAAERTTQLPAACAAGMSEKPNPAMNAVSNASLQRGIKLHDRVQGRLILLDNWLGAVILVPIWPEREKLLDGYGKKARVSVKIWTVFCTPSSYRIGA